MIDNGCLYHVLRVKDLECKPLSIETVLLVRDFPDVFPNDLLGDSPEREIEFGIDLLPNTNPISFPPFRIVPS